MASSNSNRINHASGSSANPISASYRLIKEKSKELTNTIDDKRNKIGLDNQGKKLHNLFLGYIKDFFNDNITFSESDKQDVLQSDFYQSLSNDEKKNFDNLMNECIKKNTVRRNVIDQKNNNLDQQLQEKEDQYLRYVERQTDYHEFMRDIVRSIEEEIKQAELLFHQQSYNEATSRALQAKDMLKYNNKILGLLKLQLKIIMNNIPLVKRTSLPRGDEYDRIMYFLRKRINDLLDISERNLLKQRGNKKKTLMGQNRNDSNYQEALHTVPQGKREEVYTGAALRGFKMDGIAYQLTIVRQKIKLCDANGKNIDCHIVQQSHGTEKLFTILDTKGNTLTNRFFQDYRLTKEGNKVFITIKDRKDGKFEKLVF